MLLEHFKLNCLLLVIVISNEKEMPLHLFFFVYKEEIKYSFTFLGSNVMISVGMEQKKRENIRIFDSYLLLRKKNIHKNVLVAPTII